MAAVLREGVHGGPGITSHRFEHPVGPGRLSSCRFCAGALRWPSTALLATPVPKLLAPLAEGDALLWMRLLGTRGV